MLLLSIPTTSVVLIKPRLGINPLLFFITSRKMTNPKPQRKRPEVVKIFQSTVLRTHIRVRLYRLGMSNRLSVEDVIQHVELCLHEKLESGEQIYSLIPWARVVSERYISAQRKKLRNFEPSEPDKIEHMANRQSNHNLPFDEKEELHEKINQLKPENKKILDLSFFKGYSGKEIAEFLSKEYGTIVRVDAVRKKKERAMDELRKKYL